MEQIKKYIRGNSKRGKEVIAELEKLGGVNQFNFKGVEEDKIYFIVTRKFNAVYCIDLESEKSLRGQLILTHPEWEEIKLPEQFKDGDILTNERGSIFIYKGPMYYNKLLSDFYCGYRISDGAFVPKLFKDKNFGSVSECRFASEKEKQKLFTIIRENGYKWDSEKKELEKLPKFKVGDKIKDRNNRVWFVVQVSDKCFDISSVPNAEGYFVPIEDQDEYELVPNKFDINTLKPFDKVLVRDDNECCWHATFYSHHTGTYFYSTNGLYTQCIPFEDNKHLLGTTNDCDNFYKTWEE